MKEQDAEIKEFQAYLEAEAKSQNKDPKSYIENLGEDGLKKAYQRFQDWKQKKTKKAAHGLKLNYIRRLKNQCEDGEVLVYYKTGGSIGCKCMKAQSGTELPNSASSHKIFPERQEKLKMSLKQNKGKNYRELVQRGVKKSKPKASTLPNTNNTPAKATPIPPSTNPSKHNNKVSYAQLGALTNQWVKNVGETVSKAMEDIKNDYIYDLRMKAYEEMLKNKRKNRGGSRHVQEDSGYKQTAITLPNRRGRIDEYIEPGGNTWPADTSYIFVPRDPRPGMEDFELEPVWAGQSDQKAMKKAYMDAYKYSHE